MHIILHQWFLVENLNYSQDEQTIKVLNLARQILRVSYAHIFMFMFEEYNYVSHLNSQKAIFNLFSVFRLSNP